MSRIEDGGPALLPCPFCGVQSTDFECEGADHIIYCNGCGASLYESSQKDAKIAWNRRAPSAEQDLLAALEAIVASLSEQDHEGLIEHAEQMIAARAAIARARSPSEPLNARTQGVEVGR